MTSKKSRSAEQFHREMHEVVASHVNDLAAPVREFVDDLIDAMANAYEKGGIDAAQDFLHKLKPLIASTDRPEPEEGSR